MNAKIIVAALLAFIAYFFSGWGVYAGILNNMMIYPDGMKENIMYPEAEFKISFMSLSCLIWAIMIAWLMDKVGATTWLSGAKYGAIIGGLVALSVGLGYASQFKFGSLHNTLLDMVGTMITSGIAGAVAGWWLGRK